MLFSLVCWTVAFVNGVLHYVRRLRVGKTAARLRYDSLVQPTRLRIIHVTDTYTLENFPSLKTLIQEKKNEMQCLGGSTVSIHTGDFLAPYLLSSLDKGVGMMSMLNETPIDYLIWGNHESDLPHAYVMRREKEYRGVWINSNMKTHPSFKDSSCQVEYAIIDVVSPDGSNRRKVGMIGVLTASKGLYKGGAFGGAVIDDPWECMERMKLKLKEEGCDMVLPLCHLYEKQDEQTCEKFDFPVVLSGHDHHRVDRVINGTRLLKPGSDAHFAVILDLTWDDSEADSTPTIDASTIAVADYTPNPQLMEEMTKAYAILEPLKRTELVSVPSTFLPLTSVGSRRGRVSMATYLLTQIRKALNLDTGNSPDHCDCVLILGGHIRGGKDYDSPKLSLEILNSEFHGNQDVHIFKIPGHVLEGALKESWTCINSGWIQYDDSVEVDYTGLVVKIAGTTLDPQRIYRVGSFEDLQDAYGSPSLHQYIENNPDSKPDMEAGIEVHALLLKLFSEDILERLRKLLDADRNGSISAEELEIFDTDKDGKLSKEELRAAIENVVGLATDEREDTLIDGVMNVAGDINKDGQLTLQEINANYIN